MLHAVAPDGQEAAIKLARFEGETANRLRREIATLHAVARRDPTAASWTVTVLNHGEHEGRPWMALPWYPHSLRSWVEQTAPPLPRLATALVAASTALIRFQASGESAGQPRVHRDVKPDNFLVRATDTELTVVLADFGGARSESLAAPDHPSVHYTPRYGPPEQTLLRTALPDPGVDAHALAVTIYWCITTREPDAKGPMVPYTRAGRRLLELQCATHLSEAEAAELGELQRAPLPGLLDLDDMTALTDADAQRLLAAFEDELRRDGADPGTAPALVAPLLHALRRALHPDPERRDGDLRKLVAACEGLAAALGAPRYSTAAAAPTHAEPVAPPRPPDAQFRAPTARPAEPETPVAPEPTPDRDPMAVILAICIGLLAVVVVVRVWLG
ncbi:hypothetical protein LBMAG42_38610 [Deltaproteobacteria bacterium]|nr:hypothetical protein LBMAG42_38610 [Deltaproteobacteria bacterium]